MQISHPTVRPTHRLCDRPARPAARFAAALAVVFMLCGLVLALGPGCSSPRKRSPQVVERVVPQLHQQVALSPNRQWTGVAVTETGRLFVNYPRWGGLYTNAVEELLPDGSRVAYPNATINTWSPDDPGIDPSQRFVCVQALYADGEGGLWVLDPANPSFEGVVEGGPKLVRINLNRDRLAETFRFADPIVTPSSYLNDVRIDTERGFAYITDSGDGALIVLDIKSGKARRVLDGHPSTQAEPGFVPVIEGREWRAGGDGPVPQIHADGIALSPDGDYLYWQALTARDLYRIPTKVLREMAEPESVIAASIEHLGRTVVTDGMLMDDAGYLYFSSLETDSVMVREPGTGALWVLCQGPDIAWPDSFAMGPGGMLHFTTAQIHRGPAFTADGTGQTEPYRLFKVPAPWSRSARTSVPETEREQQ